MMDLIKECAELREKIDSAFVEIQQKEIDVRIVTESVSTLTQRREYLTEEKNEAERRQEELKIQTKAQNELAAKRLQQRLNRDKSAETKELLAQEEMLILSLEDLNSKLDEESKKYSQLVHEKIILEEKLKLKRLQLNEDSEKVETQQAVLDENKKSNDEQSATLDEMSAELEQEKKTKLREEARNRDLQLKLVALGQQLQFIEQNYDYKGNVSNMNLDTLGKVVKSNNQVSSQG